MNLINLFTEQPLKKNIDATSTSNLLFLESLSHKQLESLLVSLSSNITIIKNDAKVKNKYLNNYYNQFFSLYKEIVIGDNQIVISYEQFLSCKKNKTLLEIGSYSDDKLYVKKNSRGMGVFIENIDNISDIENEKFLYSNIYVFILHQMAIMYFFEMKSLYEKSI